LGRSDARLLGDWVTCKPPNPVELVRKVSVNALAILSTKAQGNATPFHFARDAEVLDVLRLMT